MLRHIDGSKQRWLNDGRWYDLMMILNDANSEIYYAQLVEEESTRTKNQDGGSRLNPKPDILTYYRQQRILPAVFAGWAGG